MVAGCDDWGSMVEEHYQSVYLHRQPDLQLSLLQATPLWLVLHRDMISGDNGACRPIAEPEGLPENLGSPSQNTPKDINFSKSSPDDVNVPDDDLHLNVLPKTHSRATCLLRLRLGCCGGLAQTTAAADPVPRRAVSLPPCGHLHS